MTRLQIFPSLNEDGFVLLPSGKLRFQVYQGRRPKRKDVLSMLAEL